MNNTATVSIKHNTLTLPREWVRELPGHRVAVTWLGDMLIVRPAPMAKYTPVAERKALKAIETFERDRNAGRIKKLQGRLSDLMA